MTDYLTLDLESVENPKAGWKVPEKLKETEGYKNGTLIPMPPPSAQRIVSACSIHLKTVGINDWEPIFIDWGPDLENLSQNKEDLLDESLEYEMCKRLNSFLNNFVSYTGGTVITFNGRGFDIPLFYTRCMVFGLDTSGWYTKDFRYRFSDTVHLDLLDATTEYGAVYKNRPSLSLLCHLFGLPGKVGIDGSQVAAEYQKGNYKEIRDYCMSDNMDTAIVALRWMVSRGLITIKEYTRAVNKIITEACRKDEEGNPIHAHTCEIIEDDRTDYNSLFLINRG